jgi:hypothetical protein
MRLPKLKTKRIVLFSKMMQTLEKILSDVRGLVNLKSTSFHNYMRLFTVMILISCNTPSETEQTESETPTATETSAKPEVNQEKLRQLSERLNGFWLSHDYLITIENTKSVYKNREYATRLFGFTLNTENLMSDNPHLNGFTAHEGGYGTLLSYNPEKHLFENDMDKLAEFDYLKDPFEIQLKDTNLIEMVFLNNDKKEIYRKVVDDHTEFRRILFEGDYIDQATQTEVTLHRDGQVIGLKDKKYYQVVYDFVGVYGADIIFLSENDNHIYEHPYHYKIQGDTVSLFGLIGEFPDDTIGGLSYTFVRKK